MFVAACSTVVIVGGGFAGITIAREVLRDPDAQVVLADPSPRIGTGVAYGACEPWHLLNSPAGTMSADARRPDDFTDWLRRHELPAERGDFASRAVYGEYLQDSWNEVSAASADRITVLADTAVRLHTNSDGVTVGFASGAVVNADHMVAAVGNPKSGGPLEPSLAGYVPNPWRLGALDPVADAAGVLLIGTGLTAVDVLLSLQRRGRRASVLAVSRHGLVPQSHHPDSTDAAKPRLVFRDKDLLQLLREVRQAARDDWRPVVDGMRGDLNAMWQQLTSHQQHTFVTHLARYWEVHRHRMAPSVAREVDELRETDGFLVRSDAVISGQSLGSRGIEVGFASGTVERFDAVVNCTGPSRLPLGGNPFVRQLVDDGQARPGPHRLGLDVDTRGRLLDRHGNVNPRLWTIGALRRGVLWETTAVPEIREQAADIATQLTGDRLPRTGAVL